MLILSRNVQESLVINNNITLKVLSIKGNQVRLGFEAPRDIPIYREEIFNRIKEQLRNLETQPQDI